MKFGGGFYCAKIDGIYVFNGFFMEMRGKYTGDAKILYRVVNWDPSSCGSWADFRGKLLGPTDPADAPAGSLRGQVATQWEALGLPGPCDVGDNAVHASASPFEALAEKHNWLQVPINDDTFGEALLHAGIPLATIKAWCVDPQVAVPGSKLSERGSLFDQLEDLDSKDCLSKCVEIALLNDSSLVSGPSEINALALKPLYVLQLRNEAAHKVVALDLQKQGEDALASGDNTKAVELLLQALASDPDNAEIKAEEVLAEKKKRAEELKAQGDAQMQAGEYAAALGSYQTAQSLTPDDVELGPRIEESQKKVDALALKRQGEHEVEARDYAAAVATFDDALGKWPECDGTSPSGCANPWPENEGITALRDEAARKLRALDLLSKSQTYLQDGKPEEAAKLLQEALALDPDNQSLQEADIAAGKKLQASKLKEKAISQMKHGEFADAVGTWDEVFALEPLNDVDGNPREGAMDELALKEEAEKKSKGKAIGAQAAMQLEQGHIAEAIASFDAALALVPASSRATDENRLHDKLEAERAAAIAKQQAELAKQVDELLEKARRLLAAGDTDGALCAMKEALALDPENAEVLALDAEAERKKSILDEIRGLTEKGEEAMKGGHNKKALKYFNKALDVFKEAGVEESAEKTVVDDDLALVNEVLVLTKQGEAQFASEKFAEAVASFEQALAIEPESEALQDWLKKAEDAASCGQKADALVDEGIVLFQAKSIDDAEGKFNGALEVCPGHARALEWLANCVAARQEEQVAIDRFNESEANKELIRAAAEMAAKDAFVEIGIDLSNVEGTGKLNFMRFIKWWQAKMQVAHSKLRITDEELQICQRIWHEYDDDGTGVSLEDLTSILQKMLKAGAIAIAGNGQIVIAKRQ